MGGEQWLMALAATRRFGQPVGRDTVDRLTMGTDEMQGVVHGALLGGIGKSPGSWWESAMAFQKPISPSSQWSLSPLTLSSAGIGSSV